MPQGHLSILPSSQAKSKKLWPSHCLSHSNSCQSICWQSRQKLLLARARHSKSPRSCLQAAERRIKYLLFPISCWKRDLQESPQAVGPLCSLQNLRMTLTLQGCIRLVLCSAAMLLQTWAQVRLSYTAILATHPKTCYWKSILDLT